MDEFENFLNQRVCWAHWQMSPYEMNTLFSSVPCERLHELTQL